MRHAPISACGAPRLAFHNTRDIPPVRQFGDSNRKGFMSFIVCRINNANITKENNLVALLSSCLSVLLSTNPPACLQLVRPPVRLPVPFACLAVGHLWLFRQIGAQRCALWVVLGSVGVRQRPKSASGAPQISEEPPLSHIPVRQFGGEGGVLAAKGSCILFGGEDGDLAKERGLDREVEDGN